MKTKIANYILFKLYTINYIHFKLAIRIISLYFGYFGGEIDIISIFSLSINLESFWLILSYLNIFNICLFLIICNTSTLWLYFLINFSYINYSVYYYCKYMCITFFKKHRRGLSMCLSVPFAIRRRRSSIPDLENHETFLGYVNGFKSQANHINYLVNKAHTTGITDKEREDFVYHMTDLGDSLSLSDATFVFSNSGQIDAALHLWSLIHLH